MVMLSHDRLTLFEACATRLDDHNHPLHRRANKANNITSNRSCVLLDTRKSSHFRRCTLHTAHHPFCALSATLLMFFSKQFLMTSSPDTEIDWGTYMIQIEIYLKG